MLKTMKKITALFIFTLMLNACADSASVNQQAATSYLQTVNEAKQKGVVDTSSTTSKRIHQVFNKMYPYANRENNTGQPFNWQITVIKSNELNAWAMPGGKMAFYTGLVDKLHLNDDEIATVMGHEMAHALKEHGKKKVNMGTFTNVVAQVAHIALSTQIGSEGSGLIIGITKDWALDKPYSRSAETEADEVGLFLMAKAGYNPEAAPKLWEKMQTASSGNSGVLAALSSTHPSDKDRQANLLRLMPEAVAIYKGRQ
ncbi:M48 family metallopeptidase [Avibacterium sp. 20-15]|uniref:M48 family metallopeptidase n=1 Tax=unclassified Avibacterium TaxID=2685287 RepID=UPI0020262FD9|nr:MULTISPECIES: M48 family metallopeptidase [unclassified Avibacterium]MCW9733272.1 M48 family metallopeptidase [Avibacterium sp. 20-15]URL05388.1 M48 family metallopeptidase [Avibacterium sp. 20-132]